MYNFLIHYPTIILNSGPPRHYWCFRYEEKHKEIKMYAHATSSRKNISLTLAKNININLLTGKKKSRQYYSKQTTRPRTIVVYSLVYNIIIFV